MKVKVHQLQPGDYVVQAKATVKSIDWVSCLVIVDFTDGTATPPIAAGTEVEIRRAA